MSLLILAMASVSASDVSDISDNQDIISNQDSISEDTVSENVDLSVADLESSDDSDSNDSVSESDNPKIGSSEIESDSLNADSQSEGETTKNSTSIEASSSSVVYGNDYTVTLKDKNGNVLSGKNLIFTFNGNNYTRTTDSNGVASIKIDAAAGTYTISVLFEGDDLHENSSSSSKVTVSKASTSISTNTKYAVKGETYSVVLKDKDGKVLSKRNVILTYNGKTYNKTTNSKGIVSIKITGAVAKTYKLTYKFAGDEYYKASSGSVSLKVKMATSLTGASTVVKGNKYSVTLKNANGKALSGRTVTFTINGKSYKKTTNSKGVVSLKISLASPRAYDLKVKYAGSSYYGASAKEVSLFVKTPTKIINSGSSIGKGTKYYLTLKDSSNNVLSGKTVTLTYRGKTYKKTTNSKGVVSLKINSAIGKRYVLKYKFAGTKYYGPSSGSVNLRIKNATTLTGPASTTIIKGNAYKVTLKADNGKAISGQKITFTFNGKTYTRTTNKKGVASLTISAAAGKTYKFSYKFAGTSYYNRSASGTINLAVKIKSSFKNSGAVIMNNTPYLVHLKDSSGNPLASKNVTFTFDGKTYQNKTDANGTVGLLINVASPKVAKLTYKFAGDNKYDASSGSVSLDAKSDKIFTFDHIVAGAVKLRTFVEKNGKMAATISINGIKMNMSSFAYLLAKAVENINNGKKSDVALVDVQTNYTNGGNSSINADLNKTKYVELSKDLTDYIEDEGRLPNFISTVIGKMSPNLYIYGLAKSLDFYSDMNRLPNYVTFDARDVNGGNGNVTKKGNASQYKKGLNEVQSLSSSELAKYLKSSGNDALNSAIKSLANSLTAGKSTVWAKAEAIFNWVRDNVDYEYYANTKYKATGTLSKKKGNCCDHANLIVALCRAADIPARYSHGKNCKFSSGLNTGHVWAQIYVDGVWYSADATSSRNKLGNIQNWNTNSFTLKGQYIHLEF
ncbi:MAG: hypothetical protein E7Z75_06955 [Methanobrevibacter olleyae]|uniref:Big-1 domain-containing protein n=1 Tax=Methanobrevibacter olleyae TaxID=294671 RepID=A0A8T3VUA0_METOL|nr:hypothetical protein [Methanobrevibacter olleyae]